MTVARGKFPALGADFVHDLRNCVAVVSGFADLLREAHEEKLRADCCARILWACHLMKELTDNGLDAERLRQGRWQLELAEQEVTSLVTECLAAAAPAAVRKQITITSELPETQLILRTDRLAFCRILTNLLSNAIKFSRPGTRVRVCLKQAEVVQLEVHDQGPGIPEESLAGLCRAFATGPTRPTGSERTTGLGLAIVKQLAEALGGSLRVRSRLGQGTTFVVVLPPRPGDQATRPQETRTRVHRTRSLPREERWFTLGEAYRASRRALVKARPVPRLVS